MVTGVLQRPDRRRSGRLRARWPRSPKRVCGDRRHDPGRPSVNACLIPLLPSPTNYAPPPRPCSAPTVSTPPTSFAEMLATDGVVRGLTRPPGGRPHLGSAPAQLRRDGAAAAGGVICGRCRLWCWFAGSGAGDRPPGHHRRAGRAARSPYRVPREAVAFARARPDRVSVVRARAEEIAARPAMFHVKPADVVTARAVAPLDRLAGWCLPLAAVGGRLLAMKGSSAAEEIAAHAPAIARLGGGPAVIRMCGGDVLGCSDDRRRDRAGALGIDIVRKSTAVRVTVRARARVPKSRPSSLSLWGFPSSPSSSTTTDDHVRSGHANRSLRLRPNVGIDEPPKVADW